MGVYDSFIALALRLINEKGRAATLQRKADPSPADPTKPWRVAAAGAGETSEWSIKIVEIAAAVDRPEGVTRSRDDKTFLIAASGLGTTIQLTDFIVDGSTKYSIQNVVPIKPGEDIIMYEVLGRAWPPRSNS